LALAESQLADAQLALEAGKIIDVNISGLMAAVADEQQTLIKLDAQWRNYLDDFKQVTGIHAADSLVLDPIQFKPLVELNTVEHYEQLATQYNNNLERARLTKQKALYGIKASKQAYLPDLGLVGGHIYQDGLSLLADNTSFVGLSFRWNIQSMFSNSYTVQQNKLKLAQAEENQLNEQEQIHVGIRKNYRELKQSQKLIEVASKVVHFRQEAFALEEQRKRIGLSTETVFLAAKADLAKAEADLFAAQLAYRMALTNMQVLTGHAI
jgi:outer membrane protein TolC